MAELLQAHPEWLEQLQQETSESAEVMGKYLRLLSGSR